MGHKVMRWMGYGALLATILAVVVLAAVLKHEHSSAQFVHSLDVNVSGGGACPLADVESINHWIREHGLYAESMKVESVEVGAIERTTLSHSAVASANAFVNYEGSVIVDVELRTPIARLRIDGYDMYITEDGFLLPIVEDRTAAVPVITGGYKPLFSSEYTGYAAQVVRDSIASLEEHIESLEAAKLPYYRQLDTNDSELRQVINDRVRKGMFMSKEEYKILFEDYERRKVSARERHTAKKREIEAAIAELGRQQQEARMKQHLVESAGDDFEALLGFLKGVNNSKFWQAEIVQIMLDGGDAERMELRFVPRSGRFVVDLGMVTELDGKLADLYRFYNKGLDKLGWDKYSHISLRYEGQVVCR